MDGLKRAVTSEMIGEPIGATGVPLYVRVAMSLRSEINQRTWKEGDLLPRFEKLAERYGVGMNTVRKAIELLGAEKLVSTARGTGTRVIGNSHRKSHPHIRTTISDPLVISPDVRIKILQSTEVGSIPIELQEDYAMAPRYRRVHKLHSFQGTPFTLLDIYIDAEIYARFPAGDERRHKLSWLMRQYGEVEIDRSREELTISHADQSSSSLLQYPTAAALARLRRWHLDGDGRVMYACVALYRGDLFVWDISQSGPGRNTLDRQIIPAIRLDNRNRPIGKSGHRTS